MSAKIKAKSKQSYRGLGDCILSFVRSSQKDAASIPHALKISKAPTLQSLRRLYLFFVEKAVCKG